MCGTATDLMTRVREAILLFQRRRVRQVQVLLRRSDGIIKPLVLLK